MIITQTPLRIGLVGGGTDLPAYYREHGGRVLNTAIDKYVYVIVKQRFDDDIYINYSQKEIVSRVEDVQHDLVREAMHMAGIRAGVEITTLADIPSAGSGLGSSSAVTVGLLHALFAYQGRQVTAEELAERACAIEIDRCGKPIGKQDQYAAAFGGVCDMRFGPGDRVSVDRISLGRPDHHRLQDELMLFYTGITRSADTILERADGQHRRPPPAAPPAAGPGRGGRRRPARRGHARRGRSPGPELGGEARAGIGSLQRAARRVGGRVPSRPGRPARRWPAPEEGDSSSCPVRSRATRTCATSCPT